MANRSYDRGERPDFRQGYLRGGFEGSRSTHASERSRDMSPDEPADRYGRPAIRRPAGPGGYAPFGNSLYESGYESGHESGGGYPMTPTFGTTDWRGHADFGSHTTPSIGREGFPDRGT